MDEDQRFENLVSEELSASSVQAKYNFVTRQSKRDKSLAMLSLRMVKEFFKTGAMQGLEQLADKLDGDCDSKRKKTMIRRLYDITNVLKALGLVKKSSQKDKNVVIEWLGNFISKPRHRGTDLGAVSAHSNKVPKNRSQPLS